MAHLTAKNLIDPRESGQELAFDYLKGFRDRAWMVLGFSIVPFLLPFSINNFFQERPVLGLLTYFLMLVLTINSITLYRSKQQVIPYWTFYTMILFLLLYAIYVIGVKSLFWSYPIMFIMAFITERKTARVMTMICLCTLIPFSFIFISFDLASRFTATIIMISFFSDFLVSHLNKLQSKLTEYAIRDPLTNALNRRQLFTYLNEAIEETKRGFGPACLLLLDIDHFKNINDTLGHELGDAVIKRMADILQQRKRKIDYVFRIGGEEFLILLRNTPLKNGITTADNLRKYVEDYKLLNDRNVTISLGVAEYQEDETADEWQARADSHLYEAKRNGRNCVSPDTCN